MMIFYDEFSAYPVNIEPMNLKSIEAKNPFHNPIKPYREKKSRTDKNRCKIRAQKVARKITRRGR